MTAVTMRSGYLRTASFTQTYIAFLPNQLCIQIVNCILSITFPWNDFVNIMWRQWMGIRCNSVWVRQCMTLLLMVCCIFWPHGQETNQIIWCCLDRRWWLCCSCSAMVASCLCCRRRRRMPMMCHGQSWWMEVSFDRSNKQTTWSGFGVDKRCEPRGPHFY